MKKLDEYVLARWEFEKDKKNGAWKGYEKFEDLPMKASSSYVYLGELYLLMKRVLPSFIINRAHKEGYTISVKPKNNFCN